MFKKIFGFHDIIVKSNMKVCELKDSFEKSFGTKIRIYRLTSDGKINTSKGSRVANDDSTLDSICLHGTNICDITIRKSYTVEFVENEFSTKMGIGVKIMSPDGSQFAPNYMKIKDVIAIPAKETISDKKNNIEYSSTNLSTPKEDTKMALTINGLNKVKTLKAKFKEEFGVNIRVYKGVKFADDATLASIRKGDSTKSGEFEVRGNTKVGNVEKLFLENWGIKVQIESSDGKLADNSKTLASLRD